MRNLVNPSAGGTVSGVLKPHEGGTGQSTLPAATTAILAVPTAAVGANNGVASLDSNAKMLAANIPVDMFSVVSLVGPTVLMKGVAQIYEISNYDVFTDYVLESITGTVERNQEFITYTAPLTTGAGGFKVNGRMFNIEIRDAVANTPTITSPVNAAAILDTGYTLTSTPYSVSNGDSTHGSSDWQIASDTSFQTIVAESLNDSVNLTSWVTTNLTDGSTLYARVRYKGNTGTPTEWSATVTFTVAVPSPAAVSITSPANGSTNLTGSQTITTSAYSIQGNVSAHASTDWQVSVNADFSNPILNAVNDATNRVSRVVTGLVEGTLYYFRARHRAANGKYSAWSAAVSTTITIPTPVKPSITSPANNSGTTSATQVFTANAFSITGNAAAHASSDWQLATDAGFSNIVSSATADTSNKTSWTVGPLTDNVSYYARVRYNAANGKVSPWSDAVRLNVNFNFTANVTIASSVNNYNMRSAAIGAGWNGILPLKLTVTVNPGVIVGSGSTSSYAFDTDGGFPAGTTLALINNGGIYGAGGGGGSAPVNNDENGYGGAPAGGGGSGGPALYARTAITITNNGTIGGGGGGGGGGGSGAHSTNNNSGWSAGGAGGSGAGASAGGIYGATAGVASPGPSYGCIGGTGGSGGSLGTAGATGEAGTGNQGVGGAGGGGGGAAVTGNGNVTWNATGIRLGALT
jgi:hypothetical protein